MAHRPRGTSPVSVMNTARVDVPTATKTSAPTAQPNLDQQVAALIGPGPVERFGPYHPSTTYKDTRHSATRLVPDLRWNAVVPLPAQANDASDKDVIYICPARFRGRGLPLHLITYAAQCLTERVQKPKRSLTILMNLKDWKMSTPYFDVQQWVACWFEMPKRVNAHSIILVNTAESPDFPQLLEQVKQVRHTQSNQESFLPEWLHICATVTQLQTLHGLSGDNLPNDLKTGKLPMYRVVEDFIHYRQTLEGLLERREQHRRQQQREQERLEQEQTPPSPAVLVYPASYTRNSSQKLMKPRLVRKMSTASLVERSVSPRRSGMHMLRRTASVSCFNYDPKQSPVRSPRVKSPATKTPNRATSNSAVKAKQEKTGSEESALHEKTTRPVARLPALKRAASMRHFSSASGGGKSKAATAINPSGVRINRAESTRSLSQINESRETALSSRTRPRLTHRQASVPNLPKRITCV